MRVLEYLEIVGEGADSIYRCTDCGGELGSAAEDYKSFAGAYDEPMSYGQPAGRGPETSEFVLRHYICPACGTLFEVDLLHGTDDGFRSIEVFVEP
jgi:acetone carboxylase gamma subunit